MLFFRFTRMARNLVMRASYPDSAPVAEGEHRTHLCMRHHALPVGGINMDVAPASLGLMLFQESAHGLKAAPVNP